MSACEGGLVDLAASALRRHREGDSTAMPELVERVTPLLWHVARGQGLEQTLAEDVVQTTWLRLVQHVDGIADPTAVLKWLIVTAKRESWAVARRDRRTEATADHELVTIVDSSDGPEALAVAEESGTRLWRHFRSLPERCQQLLRLVVFADQPDYRAVSEALGMPVGSIGPTRGRCLAKLRLSLSSDPAWEGAS